MIMVDKGYFDYDYEPTAKPEAQVNWEDTIKSEDEVQGILAAFGLGTKKPETLEEIQGYLIKEEKYDGSRNTCSY